MPIDLHVFGSLNSGGGGGEQVNLYAGAEEPTNADENDLFVEADALPELPDLYIEQEFSGTNLSKIVYHGDYKVVPVYAHYLDSTQEAHSLSVELVDSIEEIQADAFKNQLYMTMPKLPTSLKRIKARAFRDCRALEVTLPEGLTEIATFAFYHCKLKTVVVPSTVTVLNESVFEGCGSMTSLTLSEGLTEIKHYALKDCGSLTELRIPSTVTDLGSQIIFQSGITKVYFLGKPSYIHSNAFQYASNVADIYVPWSEGEVSGAKWGAPSSAVVHYDWSE